MKTERKAFPWGKKKYLLWSRGVTTTVKKKLFYYKCSQTKQTFFTFCSFKTLLILFHCFSFKKISAMAGICSRESCTGALGLERELGAASHELGWLKWLAPQGTFRSTPFPGLRQRLGTVVDHWTEVVNVTWGKGSTGFLWYDSAFTSFTYM